jgi:tRNA threonylcarbamoyl adenosine modification protein YeaZ
MTALILDSSGAQVFLALADKGKVVSHLILPEARQMSKTFLPAIETLVGHHTLDYIAVGKGPGTFTGTRVGAITAQTLAFAWKIPCLSFSSTLLPDVETIASLTYQQFLLDTPTSHIELVYISPDP